jgi:hypothetical protein
VQVTESNWTSIEIHRTGCRFKAFVLENFEMHVLLGRTEQKDDVPMQLVCIDI